MSIENLKKLLEIERVKKAHGFRCKSDIINEDYGSFNDYQYGSKHMENRLLPLLQKAVEMAEFVINHSQENTYNNIKAREFLSEFTKMTEIKKEGL